MATQDAADPTSSSDQTDPTAEGDLSSVVGDGIAAAYEQAAGAPVEVALEAVLEEEQERGVELNEDFARPFAEAISKGENPIDPDALDADRPARG